MPSLAVVLLGLAGLLGSAQVPADPRVVAADPRDVGAPEAALAREPPMGWNSWNTFGCDIDEGKIRSVADALVRSGMREAGYRYVVVDDCWYSPQRDAAGNLRADPRRFPSGMAALGDYLHSRGLGFGLYMSPNVRTCAQQQGTYPGATGSGDHELRDARGFAAWEVDYLKYDWCFGAGSEAAGQAAFRTMRDALAATGRPIVYGINPNSNAVGQPGQRRDWCGIAQLSRTTEDIAPSWRGESETALGVRDIIEVNAGLTERARPGCWNDPDMLEVGVGGSGGLTADEARTHMSMWAMVSAPLMTGNDPRSTSEVDRSVLTRREVLAVDQDPLGKSATRLVGGDHQVWAKPLREGTAVALYNRADQPAVLGTDLRRLGLAPGDYRVRDLWDAREYSTTDALSVRVPAHGTVLLRLEPEHGEPD